MRGKQKLSDRWESSLYIVVDTHVETNTFKIENSSAGQVKIVHHNLIMPVNFLPLPDDVAEGPVGVEGCVGSEETQMLEHLPQPAADERTVEWVSDIECSRGSKRGSVLSEDDVGSQEMMGSLDGSRDSVVLAELEDSVRLVCPIDNESDLDINSNLTAFDRLSSDVDCQSDVATVATVQSDSTNDVGRLMTSVRSGAGRLIRPVVRLIETMQVQKLDNQVNAPVWI